LRNKKEGETIKTAETTKTKKSKKVVKVCALCGETFETTEEWRDTCLKCKRKPMFPDREAADEVVYH